MPKWSIASGAVLVLALSTGCGSDMADDGAEGRRTATVKSTDEARAEARTLSSEILDVIAVQSDVSEGGPGISTCEDDPERERLYTVRHPWAIYGASRAQLESGMDRLRQQLPDSGWEILEDGEQNNANRSPRILMENTDLEYALNIVLAGGPQDDPQLEVTLVSGCFSTPEGQSPRGEF